MSVTLHHVWVVCPCICQASCHTNLNQGLICLYLLSHPRNAFITDTCYHDHYVGSRSLNSGPHTSVATAFTLWVISLAQGQIICIISVPNLTLLFQIQACLWTWDAGLCSRTLGPRTLKHHLIRDSRITRAWAGPSKLAFPEISSKDQCPSSCKQEASTLNWLSNQEFQYTPSHSPNSARLWALIFHTRTFQSVVSRSCTLQARNSIFDLPNSY